MADPKGILPTTDAWDRVSDTVREVESRSPSTPRQRRYYPRGGGEASLFPVLVNKDGGNDGTSSSQANWTYSVWPLGAKEGDDPIATEVEVVKPRPAGSLVPQFDEDAPASFESEPMYGLAFTGQDGELVLWDAGEVEFTLICGEGL